MTNSPYKITVYDKQGRFDFVGHYPTFKQACEVSDYLKATNLYSEIRISSPDGLGEEVEND
ncbi:MULTISPECIES: hypothetical protein [Pasteurellaceae]|uniref:hypothetical protein n=1 Tax=Pasteurellaceae TaxID=712 RepID=UPI0029201F09|nr:hypothetical protein AUSP0078_00015 [uncultured phage]